MAKRDINKKTGKYSPSFASQKQSWLEWDCYRFDKERKRTERETNPPAESKGVRGTILEIYRKTNSKEEAYKAIDEINKKFGREVYPRESVDSWINEEFGISNSNEENRKGIDDGSR